MNTIEYTLIKDVKTTLKQIKKTSLMIILIYIIFNLVILPKECINAAHAAIMLCLNTVIPSLFPFFVVSNLFISLGFASILSRFISKFMNPVFGVSGAGALPVILGIISGYPVGASSSAELYNKGYISKTEAERLLAFTNNSGPLFIMGAIGYGLLGSSEKGLIIYISHITAAILTGIIFKFYKKNYQEPPLLSSSTNTTQTKNFGASIGDAMNYAVETMLKVCGFVILFSVICSCIPNTTLYPFIYSLFEITGGLNEIAQTGIDETLKLSLISFFLSLSGISVMCQVSSVVIPAGLSLKPYITGKLIQSILSFYITRILLIYFQPYKTHDVFSPIYEKLMPESLWLSSLSIILFTAISFLVLLLIGYSLELKRKK